MSTFLGRDAFSHKSFELQFVRVAQKFVDTVELADERKVPVAAEAAKRDIIQRQVAWRERGSDIEGNRKWRPRRVTPCGGLGGYTVWLVGATYLTVERFRIVEDRRSSYRQQSGL